MYKIKRVKRDTAENIYRHCKLSGTCPPDVENKVEQNTLADRLLRIFSSIIYLGGLGIGSGRGSGIATGVRPLPEEIPAPDIIRTGDTPDVPEAVGPTIRPRPSQPNPFGVPLDPISSGGNIPRVIGPTESAIVPLSESGLPDATIVTTGSGSGEGLGYEIFTNTSADTFGAVGGHPTPVAGTTENIALVEFSLSEQTPTRITYTTTDIDSGYTLVRNSAPVETDLNIFVDPRYAGVSVGEAIELEPIGTVEEFEVQNINQKTSTPQLQSQRPSTRQRLYGRYIEQIPTRNVDFLGQPSRAVQFEFDNPAFEADVSMEFERDLQELAAAPDPNFTDVIYLGRPTYSELPEGTVRVSRLGVKGKISTRSGAVLKQKSHFYYDLSTISPIEEEIELNVISESSDLLTIVDELTSGTPVDIFQQYSENDLIDIDDTIFQSGHLEIFGSDTGDTDILPSLISDVSIKPFVNVLEEGYTVSYANTHTEPSVPLYPVEPYSYIDTFGQGYYLHPSLLRRKRKRSELF